MANILTITLGGHDIACWRSKNACKCPSKTLYTYLTPISIGPHMPWTKLWSLPLPSKVKLFLWKDLQNRLPMRARLRKFIQSINPTCVLCHLKPETTSHLLCSSTASTNLWQSMHRSFLINMPQTPVTTWLAPKI